MENQILTQAFPRLQIEYSSITALKPNPRNPRIHNKKQVTQLANSINQFGF